MSPSTVTLADPRTGEALTPGEYAAEYGIDVMVDRLVEVVRTAARAEGAAEAIEAAARLLDAEACADIEAASHAREGSAPQNALRRSAADHRERAAKIRALAPAGLVAVSVDDLRHALNECGCWGPLDPGDRPWLLPNKRDHHHAAAGRVHVALTHKKG